MQNSIVYVSCSFRLTLKFPKGLFKSTHAQVISTLLNYILLWMYGLDVS